MGDKGFKPETMRVFVRLDEDGEYHEIEGLNGFSIDEEYNWCNNYDATITIRGFNTHVGDDPFYIRKAVISDTPKTYTVKVGSETFVGELNNIIDNVRSELLKMRPSKRHSYKAHLPERVVVSGPCVISFWNDGTKTISRCHGGDEMDVRTGILLNAIKKWMPGGTYWYDAIDDVTVEYQSKKETVEKPVHEPVNHDHPKRPYQRGMSYSDDEKLAALEMMEHMPVTQVSKKTGISLSCLYRWRDMFRSGND